MIAELENMVSLYLQQPGANQTIRGGYFCFMKEKSGQIMYVQQIGEVADAGNHEHCNRAIACACYAIERATNVFQGKYTYISVNRDNDKGICDYAVRIRIEGSGHILAFAGLPPKANEAVVLSAAVRRNLMPLQDAVAIAKDNDNGLFFWMNPGA